MLQEQEKRTKAVADRTVLLANAQIRMDSATRIARLMRSPLDSAMSAQKINFELGTVINVPEKYKAEALRKAQATGEALAKAGYASYAETQEIQYALNSAELSAALARSATKAVASVAKITKGEQRQVGEVLATAYNNLGSRLDGSVEQRFARIGELLTKVQFKYQIRDFGQLGEGMKYAAVGIRQHNANLEQSVTTLGMLNSAGLQGGQAGTAFNAMLLGIFKTAQDIPSVLMKNKKGELDLVATLGKLQGGLSRMSELERSAFLSEKFGEEGAKGLVPLLAKLKELESGYKDVEASSKGLVDKEMAKYLELTSTKMAAAKEAAGILAMKLGGALLPSVTEIIEFLGKIADKLAVFADKYPMITKVAVILVGLAVGANLAAASFFYLKAGFSSFITAFEYAKSVLPVMRGSLASLGKGMLALLTGPHGLLIAGIVAGAVAIGGAIYLIWKNWDWIKQKCSDIWGWMKEKWDAFCAIFPSGSDIIKGAVWLITGYYKRLWEALKKVWEWGKKAAEFLGFGGNAGTPDVQSKVLMVAGKTRSATQQRGKFPRKMASGGLVTSPTFALIGEAGPELVTPLDKLGALSAAPVTVAFSPTINVQGGGSVRQDVTAALRTSKDELKRMLEEIMRDQRRVSLA